MTDHDPGCAFAVALFVLGVIVALLGFRRLAEKVPQN